MQIRHILQIIDLMLCKEDVDGSGLCEIINYGVENYKLLNYVKLTIARPWSTDAVSIPRPTIWRSLNNHFAASSDTPAQKS
jgi:hypothetical protein